MFSHLAAKTHWSSRILKAAPGILGILLQQGQLGGAHARGAADQLQAGELTMPLSAKMVEAVHSTEFRQVPSVGVGCCRRWRANIILGEKVQKVLEPSESLYPVRVGGVLGAGRLVEKPGEWRVRGGVTRRLEKGNDLKGKISCWLHPELLGCSTTRTSKKAEREEGVWVTEGGGP